MFVSLNVAGILKLAFFSFVNILGKECIFLGNFNRNTELQSAS